MRKKKAKEKLVISLIVREGEPTNSEDPQTTWLLSLTEKRSLSLPYSLEKRNEKYRETKRNLLNSSTRLTSQSMNTVYPRQETSNSCDVKNFKRNHLYLPNSLFPDLSETSKFIWLIELSVLKCCSTRQLPNKNISMQESTCEHYT